MTTGNTLVAQNIRDHHRDLAQTLHEQVDSLFGSTGSISAEAKVALLTYLDGEILPHAAFEEKTLYRRAAEIAGLAMLVKSLTHDHRVLEGLIDRLRTEGEPMGTFAAASTLATVFETHAAKEDDFLVEPLAENPDVDLEGVLSDEGSEAPETEDIPLDVRTLPHASRHATIFALLDRLAPNQTLVITVDHDPLPLKFQLEATYPGGFRWTYRKAGPDLSEIAINRR